MTQALHLRDPQQQLLRQQGTVSCAAMKAMLMHALQLRRGCREMFLLCDVQHHTLTEAALILGISQVAAKRRLLLARRGMHEAIEHLCGSDRQD
ncbi:MAG TPA: sigma factor-like helix-turn-helix DNA-binding protein [Terriglobales bacterium]|nr:sigma factor-like helix-turn-helix DNA-binding protein [Terriglobales bacterium]